MCRPKTQEISHEQVIDHYYQEQQDNALYAIIIQQQTELEQLIQIAEKLRNDIIKLHDKEQEIIEHLHMMKKSEKSLFHNMYSFISNKSLLFFVSGFVTGFYIIPTLSKFLTSTRI